MRKLDAYIRNQVVVAMLLVLLVLGGLFFVFTLFEELGDTGGGYGSTDALRYVLLTMPRNLYELLPIAALIGALLGLGTLASANELVVMLSAGVRTLRIVWAVMKPAVGVMVLGLLLGEFVAPPLELRAELGKALASGEETVLSRYGSWQREDNRYMHFNAVDTQGILHGVTIYAYDDERHLLSNTVAERALWQGNAWLLEEVEETVFVRDDGEEVQAMHRRTDTLLVDMDLSPELLRVLIVDPERMAMSDLLEYTSYFRDQGQDASQYLLAFWKKLFQPLTTAALVLVAISFIFGPLRDSTVGARVFTAVSFGLFFIIVQRLLSTVSLVYQVNPLLAILLPIVTIALFGGWLLRRAA